MMPTKEELETNLTHILCPKIKEWSEPEGNRPYKCYKCPAFHTTGYGGEAKQMCYAIANDIAKIALHALLSSLPDTTELNGMDILKRASVIMNYYNDLLQIRKE